MTIPQIIALAVGLLLACVTALGHATVQWCAWSICALALAVALGGGRGTAA